MQRKLWQYEGYILVHLSLKQSIFALSVCLFSLWAVKRFFSWTENIAGYKTDQGVPCCVAVGEKIKSKSKHNFWERKNKEKPSWSSDSYLNVKMETVLPKRREWFFKNSLATSNINKGFLVEMERYLFYLETLKIEKCSKLWLKRCCWEKNPFCQLFAINNNDNKSEKKVIYSFLVLFFSGWKLAGCQLKKRLLLLLYYFLFPRQLSQVEILSVY